MTPNRSAEQEILLERGDLALYYLERLSADSVWAHRASGLRGSLLQSMQLPEEEQDLDFFDLLRAQVDLAYWMLKKAAMEIPDPENGKDRNRH